MKYAVGTILKLAKPSSSNRRFRIKINRYNQNRFEGLITESEFIRHTGRVISYDTSHLDSGWFIPANDVKIAKEDCL